jgi:WD40 repeat protein
LAQFIHLYDARNFTGGAFSEMKVLTKDLESAMATHRVSSRADSVAWKAISFNGSGNQMLVQADPGLAILLDGYEGTILKIFESKTSKGTVSCFTPDDQYVLMGTEAGTIEVYSVQSGSLVKTLEGHLGPVTALACNPKYAQIASSCSNTCLWIW